MPDNHEIADRLQFARDVSAEASRFILRYYHSASLAVDWKRDATPVTEADRGAEQLIREAIHQQFPGDGVLGEEAGEEPGTSGYRWILDPVDGTKSFIHAVPLFGTLIGIEHQGQCVAGVCRFPALDEVAWGAIGQGAWWQRGSESPRKAEGAKTAKLADALFCFTSIGGWETIGRVETLTRLSKKCKLSRGWGDCYGHMLVATGRAEVMVDPLMNLWDAAALLPIVTESGAKFTDWTGAVTASGGSGISVCAALHSEVLRELRA
jgi:histidinol phosphatase-like enzyme (inositol monophosphatase family)